MFEVKIHNLDATNHDNLTRVVCVSRYKNKWLFCKHKQRNTWEIPGGHIEPGETWLDAAKRELYEETGATQASIQPICLYSISTFGMLCYAEIQNLDNLPNSEIDKVEFFDDIPKNLTYPEAHTLFFETIKKQKNL